MRTSAFGLSSSSSSSVKQDLFTYRSRSRFLDLKSCLVAVLDPSGTCMLAWTQFGMTLKWQIPSRDTALALAGVICERRTWSRDTRTD